MFFATLAGESLEKQPASPPVRYASRPQPDPDSAENAQPAPPDMPAFDKTDVRHQPAYTLAEAARYLKLPQATLRAWAVGRDYPVAEGQGRFRALIEPARAKPNLLSFYNLIEAHVLRSLRTEHGVSIKALRDSIAYAERDLRLDRLLLREDLCTHGGRVLLDHYGELIELSASGQIAMRKSLEDHLARVEWDAWKFPVRLYPYPTAAQGGDHPIAIDAGIAFGRPVLVARGISTHVIAERLDAGESVADLSADYDLPPADIERAALYERAA
jgi:uncharacterized protein (DUF433 family)/DNA-binding transcriptional regulator YiaG